MNRTQNSSDSCGRNYYRPSSSNSRSNFRRNNKPNYHSKQKFRSPQNNKSVYQTVNGLLAGSPPAGMATSGFFITHTSYDEYGYPDSNIFEADLIARLALYLSHQGNFECENITILTTTPAQKDMIWEKLDPTMKHEYVLWEDRWGPIKVKTIMENDGERAKNVLISLVAPPPESQDQWLEVVERENFLDKILSLSKGSLYIVGNRNVLQESISWKSFLDSLSSQGYCGDSIKIICQRHPQNVTEIKHHYEFDQYSPDGGCSFPCTHPLSCNHSCPLKCHPIPHSEAVRQTFVCTKSCARDRPDGCNHTCPRKCFECTEAGRCPPCKFPVNTPLLCGHEINFPCSEIPESLGEVICNTPVSYKRKCGHITEILCHEKELTRLEKTHLPPCSEVTNIVFINCRHFAEYTCNDSLEEYQCLFDCEELYPCGHPCKKTCGNKNHTHERDDCTYNCRKKLICGHYCAEGCKNINNHTAKCQFVCEKKCGHGLKCPALCYEPCVDCPEPCPWRCEHIQCPLRCDDICQRTPCNVPCSKSLSCGHLCSGLCEEQCPPCLNCNPYMKCPITLRHFKEFEKDDRLYQLPDCGCVFDVQALDQYFNNNAKNDGHMAIKLWECPQCQEFVQTALRYYPIIKTQLSLWNKVKEKTFKKALTELEFQQIRMVMQEETRREGLYNTVGGRWFICPNYHPYYIGECGGAQEISQCPECRSTIGGDQHQIVPDNRFFGEFDGSSAPAWPQREI
ncbi:hypothetical protein G9A89_006837 [Geosiphon pyriformis]|nr:hypothetical protein G9A89_006837 [Geosiphon pyriformis]